MAMPVKITDWVGAILAGVVVFGFLGVITFLAVGAVPPGNEKLFFIALGSLISFAGQAVNYYLGSSSGSEKKSEQIEKMSDQKSAQIATLVAEKTPEIKPGG